MPHFRMILKLLLLIALDSCRSQRGDQDLGVGDQGDYLEFGNEDLFDDENVQDMTPENTLTPDDGSAIERINEDKVDEEIFSAERHQTFPAWKILLVVAGCVVGLVLLVSAVVLVLKSRIVPQEEENMEENKLRNTENPAEIIIDQKEKVVKENHSHSFMRMLREALDD